LHDTLTKWLKLYNPPRDQDICSSTKFLRDEVHHQTTRNLDNYNYWLLKNAKLVEKDKKHEKDKKKHYNIQKIVGDDGSMYEGDMHDGKKKGYGICVWKNKDRYIGQWKKDMMNGMGCLLWSDSEFYFGEFKKNKYDGTGEYKYKSGDRYIGGYKKN